MNFQPLRLRCLMVQHQVSETSWVVGGGSLWVFMSSTSFIRKAERSSADWHKSMSELSGWCFNHNWMAQSWLRATNSFISQNYKTLIFLEFIVHPFIEWKEFVLKADLPLSHACDCAMFRPAFRGSWLTWLWRTGPAWTSSSAPACWEIWAWPGGGRLVFSHRSLLPVLGTPKAQRTPKSAQIECDRKQFL